MRLAKEGRPSVINAVVDFSATSGAAEVVLASIAMAIPAALVILVSILSRLAGSQITWSGLSGRRRIMGLGLKLNDWRMVHIKFQVHEQKRSQEQISLLLYKVFVAFLRLLLA